MNIDLNPGAAPSPEHTLQLAAVLSDVVRVLNHQTRHHEALRWPSDADQFLREITAAVIRLPQLCGQAGAWLDRERKAGRIEVTDGPFTGDPDLAVLRVRLSLDEARVALSEAVTALEAAASVASAMAATEGDSSSE